VTTSELIPPDTEGALRDYLRADAGVQVRMAQRVFFGATNPEYPCATLTRIGGGGANMANVDDALIQVDVWGEVRDKAGCWTSTAAVLAALRALAFAPATIIGKARLHSSGATSWAWLPDVASERSRYSITVPVTAVAV
jgi:hypothetical protein